MKKAILYTLFLFPIITYAQNWDLITAENKYYFKSGNVNYISNTIFADSFSIVGNDTIFQLNRIVKDCFECDPMNPHKFKLANQGQFLQKEITKYADGTYRLYGASEYFINPHFTAGQSWLFDTVQNIVATIDTAYEEEVFGLLDSVKIILVGNDSIKISKNNGIITFGIGSSDYALSGISGQTTVGELPFQKEDFFNFNVGDVFQYWTSNWGSYSWLKGVSKITIVAKTETDSSFIYNAQVVRSDTIIYQQYEPTEYIYGSSFAEIRHRKFIGGQDSERDFLTTSYNNQLVPEVWPENTYRIVKINEDQTTGRISKVKGFVSNLSGFDTVEPPYEFLNNSDTLILRDFVVELTRRVYTVGLGQVYHYGELLDNVSRTILIGHVINGDTTGIITPDEELLVATSEEENLIEVNVFPTYSNGIYNIAHQESKLLSFEVYDVNGVVVLRSREVLSLGNTQVDIREESPGLYFLKVISREGFRVFKVVKY
jgi:hypothetical protein